MKYVVKILVVIDVKHVVKMYYMLGIDYYT